MSEKLGISTSKGFHDKTLVNVDNESCTITEKGLYCFYITGALNSSICFYVDQDYTAHSARCETASGMTVWISNSGSDVSVMSNDLAVKIKSYFKIC